MAAQFCAAFFLKAMNYQQTLDFLFNSLPMYQRVGGAAYKANLDNTHALMSYLNHPEDKFRSLHVAGTNGKGTVSHILASVLQEAGYKVGLYTSPHLIDFRERIKINGEMISEAEVVRFVKDNIEFFKSHQLSFFEMTVGLAFDYFARENVDIAVIEVGMGGRLDSTNVIRPLACAITNIGLEHTQFLGDTLAKIAGEKAGIIKPDVPVVVGEYLPETRPVFERVAATNEAPVVWAQDEVCLTVKADDPGSMMCEVSMADESQSLTIECPLAGFYQRKNFATAFALIKTIASPHYLSQPFAITSQHILDGYAHVVSNTGFHGRWEVISRNPLVVCETAHNADGVEAMLHKLATINYSHLHLVYGCVADKDYAKILRMLPTENVTRYFTAPSVPRRLAVEKLLETAHELNLPGEGYSDVQAAINAALAVAAPTDFVLITGSIFLVADALSVFQSQGKC